jgi:hypothetical protein
MKSLKTQTKIAAVSNFAIPDLMGVSSLIDLSPVTLSVSFLGWFIEFMQGYNSPRQASQNVRQLKKAIAIPNNDT